MATVNTTVERIAAAALIRKTTSSAIGAPGKNLFGGTPKTKKKIHAHKTIGNLTRWTMIKQSRKDYYFNGYRKNHNSDQMKGIDLIIFGWISFLAGIIWGITLYSLFVPPSSDRRIKQSSAQPSPCGEKDTSQPKSLESHET